MQMNAQPVTPSRRVTKATLTARGRYKLVFVFAVTILCVALIACVVLLTAIVVRRRLQQQQQQPDVRDAAPLLRHVPPHHRLSPGASTTTVVDLSDHRRRSTDVRARSDSTSSTPSSRLAVFRALQTATWSTNQLPSTLSRSDERRHRRLPTSRRRRPNGRRHRGRPRHRDRDDEVVARSAELRRLARIALQRHLRSSEPQTTKFNI